MAKKSKKQKLKTHKAAAKRLKVSGSGRVLRLKAHRSHLRRKKASRTKRLFEKKMPLSTADLGRVKKLLPYGVE